MELKKKKLEDEVMGIQPTAAGDYDSDTDYSVILKNQMVGGASAADVAATLGKRVNKASNTPGLEKYAYDDTYRSAMDYILKGNQGDGFSYSNMPGYVDKYSKQIDDLTRQLLGREPFSYNPETDPAYQQYKESYTRGGERAMQDTLAQIAARTGGLASSYAGSAAQQTYDQYMAGLADKIPELRQLAYQMYMDEGDTLRANLGVLQGLDDTAWGRYQDNLNQWNLDRDFNYGVSRDEVSDQRYTAEREYDQAMERAALLASMGDFSGYAALGLSADEIARLGEAYTAASYSGGSSGRSGSGYGGSDTGEGNIYESMYGSGVRSEADAYAWLLENGYNTTQAGKLAGYFADWLGGNSSGRSPLDSIQAAVQGVGGPNGKDKGNAAIAAVIAKQPYQHRDRGLSYDSVVKAAREAGMSEEDTRHIYPQQAWERAKAAGVDPDNTGYDSYWSYLRAFLEYLGA